MRAIRIEADHALIGAAVPHAAIVEHPLLKARASALAAAPPGARLPSRSR
jgi:CO/xanthine dehydrogenase FAD-binding subunit